MQFKVDYFGTFFRYKIVYRVLGVYSCVILLLVAASYVSYVLYQTWDRMNVLDGEIANYKSSVAFISNNKELLVQDIDTYNSVLEALIPDEESYFSVVTSLEKLAQKTGVTIKSYTIDLESTNISKLSLRVEVSGSQEALVQLLAIYKYAGGRLITVEKYESTTTGDATNVFLFNFYHQQYTVGAAAQEIALSQQDIDTIKTIAEKVQ